METSKNLVHEEEKKQHPIIGSDLDFCSVFGSLTAAAVGTDDGFCSSSARA